MGSTVGKLGPRGIVAFAIIAAWAVTLIAFGALNLNQTWGILSLAAGGATALGAAISAWRGSWLMATLLAAVIAGAALVAAGIIVSSESLAAFGVVALVLTALLAPIALMLQDLVARGSGAPMPIASGAPAPDQLRAILTDIHEHTMLSDSAKRVLFRDRETAMLRQAIEDDIAHGEYNTAISLCDDMAQLFGYREEAETYRARISQARAEHYEAQVQTAIDQLDRFLTSRDWPRAHQESARIRRLFPDSHLVHDLDQRINSARESHKRELEQQFLETAQREEVEHAMDLLRQLDRYMTREEAARIAPVAQDVVMKHRKNLETHFKLAVADRMWAEAASVGQTIMNEFPNTKMAEEVRSMIQVLRTRATQAAMTAGESAG